MALFPCCDSVLSRCDRFTSTPEKKCCKRTREMLQSRVLVGHYPGRLLPPGGRRIVSAPQSRHNVPRARRHFVSGFHSDSTFHCSQRKVTPPSELGVNSREGTPFIKCFLGICCKQLFPLVVA
ncbi:hypothetical protein BaRGS_00004979 [Batillaria attramentaria]|uniref:Uncharacterized protein n=1 Tax=Batillaria attramentaria TaxID=370345 RepID=A0ABD0LXD8_9CAEN